VKLFRPAFRAHLLTRDRLPKSDNPAFYTYRISAAFSNRKQKKGRFSALILEKSGSIMFTMTIEPLAMSAIVDGIPPWRDGQNRKETPCRARPFSRQGGIKGDNIENTEQSKPLPQREVAVKLDFPCERVNVTLEREEP
jgi:hypothetical protein